MDRTFLAFRCCSLVWMLAISGQLRGQTTDNSGLVSMFLEEVATQTGIPVQWLVQKHKIQVSYVQVNRNSQGYPDFSSHNFNVTDTYFNPASMVKYPLILLTLEKIRDLQVDSLTLETCFKIRNTAPCANTHAFTPLGPEGCPCLANEIRKILLVSDNDAYNTLFDFLGLGEINRNLRQKGFDRTKIIRRFLSCSMPDNLISNPFWFYDAQGREIYHQPGLTDSDNKWFDVPGSLMGKGHFDNQVLVNAPKDFRNSNYMSMEDGMDMLMRLICPEAYSEELRWKLSPNDRDFMLNYMSMLPRESQYSKYRNSSQYPDNYKKLLVHGDAWNGIQNADIEVFNFAGYAHGFMSDLAYVVDTDRCIEFFLGCTLYVNENDIFDGEYEFDEVARPVMGALGRVVLDHESNRFKEFYPNLMGLNSILQHP